MSSVERRRILDNIAGITKFDDDINQAEGKRRRPRRTSNGSGSSSTKSTSRSSSSSRPRRGLKYRDLNERLTTAKAQLAYKNRELIERQIVGRESRSRSTRRTRASSRPRSRNSAIGWTPPSPVGRTRAGDGGTRRGRGEAAEREAGRLRIERARATDGIETSKETLKQLRTENADATKEKGKVQKETDASRGSGRTSTGASASWTARSRPRTRTSMRSMNSRRRATRRSSTSRSRSSR